MNQQNNNQFSKWLSSKMSKTGMSIGDIANKMHIARMTVYRHMFKDKRPYFATVIAYCYIFDCMDEVDSVWKMVCDKSDLLE